MILQLLAVIVKPANTKKYSMIEYNDPQNWLNKRNAIVECANKNNLPCIDVFSNIGIDWDKEPYYNQDLDYVNGAPTLANRGIYTLDGLHLNEYGFERLARLVSDALTSVEENKLSIIYICGAMVYYIIKTRQKGGICYERQMHIL